MQDADIHIKPQDIPDYVYEMACPILDKMIRKILSDPKNREDYEQWKAQRKEENRWKY